MVWGAIVGLGAAQILGALIYSKLTLGRPWLRATFPGKTWEQIAAAQQETFHIEYVVCIFSQLALIMSIHYVIGPYLGVKSVELALKVGLGMTGLSALIDIPHLMFSRRPFVGFIIDHIYNALVFIVACVSLAYFG